MNLSALLAGSNSTLTGSGSTSTQASAATGSTSPQLTQAQKRIQADVDSTAAQLSQFGLLKSALADAQTSAKALSGLAAAATPSDTTVALGNFFKTFNASVGAAHTAASAAASPSAASNARRVVQDLKAALRADPATDAALRKLGLSVQSDGTLQQDAHKFASALAADPAGVRAALAGVGKKVDAVNSQELASNGTVGAALSSLTQHSTALTAQQSALKSMQLAMAAYQANSTTTTA